MRQSKKAPIDGARIRALREAAGLSQEELAERVGVGQPAIAKIEGGQARWPRHDTVGGIAEVLGVREGELRQYLGDAESLGTRASGTSIGDGAIPLELVEQQSAPPSPVSAKGFALEVAHELHRLYVGDSSIPVASAGPGTPGDIEEWRPSVSGTRHGRLIPVEVTGECLVPRVRPGWICWVNPEASARPGDVVLAEVDGERHFKVYQRRDGSEILSTLDERPDLVVGPGIQIIGPVDLVQHSP